MESLKPTAITATPTTDQPQRSRTLPLYLFVFFLLFNLLTVRGRYYNLDEFVMYSTIVNVYEDHSLAVDELEDVHEYVIVGSFSPDGHLYSLYPPGNLLFGLPLYALGEAIETGFGFLTTSLLNPLLNSIGLLMLFLYLRCKFSDRTALVSTLLLGISTDWWPASRGFGSETGAGVFLLGSLIASDLGRPVWGAAGFSLSFLFRPINLVAFLLMALNYLRSGKKAILSMSIIAAAGFLYLGYNFLRFQDPFNTGYPLIYFAHNPLAGFFNLLFSPGRSLFLFSPILLLSIPGAVLWWRRDRLFSMILTSTVLLYPMVIGSWDSWYGGHAWAARLLIPTFPLLAVLYAPVIDYLLSRRWLAIIIVLLALIGFGMALLTLPQDPIQTTIDALNRGIPFKDTLFSFRNSMLALQVEAIKGIPLSRFDMLVMRVLFP